MELLPAFAFFVGATYLVYRLRQIDREISRLKRQLEDYNAES